MSNGGNDMDAFKELVSRSPNVELMNFEELHSMVFWSGAAMKWSKTQIEIAKEMGGMNAQIDAWAEEGRAAAELNFAARAKRGELAKKEQQAQGNYPAGGKGVQTSRKIAPVESGEVLPKWQRLGYKTEQSMKDDELLHSNPKIVEKVKEQAKETGDFPSITAVKIEKRAQRAEAALKEAKESAAKSIAKQMDKEVKSRPKVVSDYFEAIKQYRGMLAIAVAAAKKGLFAEESFNIITTKHDEIRSLMVELEEGI